MLFVKLCVLSFQTHKIGTMYMYGMKNPTCCQNAIVHIVSMQSIVV